MTRRANRVLTFQKFILSKGKKENIETSELNESTTLAILQWMIKSEWGRPGKRFYIAVIWVKIVMRTLDKDIANWN